MASVFEDFLFNLRAHGVKVGLTEWLELLRGLRLGLAGDLTGFYHLARSLLTHSEAQFDAYDLAFSATFGGRELDAALRAKLERFLEELQAFDPSRAPGQHEFASFEAMMEALRKTLEAQQGQHHGGNRWVGSGGTSPWGTGGRANQGVQLGEGGGGRSGVRLADERRWQNYRTDLVLDVRDFKKALKELRQLAREGREVLDLDQTIDRTGKNAGEIELVFDHDKKNRVRVVLLMDSGGSMGPHAELVSRLFTAAKETKTFKTFEAYYFHNCVYQWLYKDYETYDRVRTEVVLESLRPDHRLIFVGDASMAPWELFTPATTLGRPAPSGLDRLRLFKERCAASVWLNPDPQRFWDHPTVSAIGGTFPMFPLTLAGLRDAVQYLRAPRPR